MTTRKEFRRFQIFPSVELEREYQIKKWGTGNNRTLATYIILLEKQLAECKHAILFNGSDATLSEIRQLTAVGFAAMESHGIVTRSDEFWAVPEYTDEEIITPF